MAHILLVEDNLASQRLARYILERAEHRVSVVSNGREGVEEASRSHPDLIIMDIQLPLLDGIEAALEIRSQPELKQIPIVAVTAHAMRGDEERFIAEGFDAYVSKPIRYKKLLETVTHLLCEGRHDAR